MSVNPSYKYNTISYNNNTNYPQRTNSILSDDQSSYILFNPVVAESDILSLTNTNLTNSTNQRNSDVGVNSDTHSPQRPAVQDHNQNGKIDSLWNKINEWNLSANINELVDDNIASWNLDENLSAEPFLQKPFYGDELFKNFNKADFKKFKSFHLKNNFNNKDQSIINDMLIKLLIKDGEIDKHSRASGFDEISSRSKDYIRSFNNNVEISDTNSSLILC